MKLALALTSLAPRVGKIQPFLARKLRIPTTGFQQSKDPPPTPENQPELFGTTDTKKCPMCAETIKKSAKICRFCGYDYITKAMPAKAQSGKLRLGVSSKGEKLPWAQSLRMLGHRIFENIALPNVKVMEIRMRSQERKEQRIQGQ